MTVRNGCYLLILDAVFENVLDDKTASFAQGYFVPHSLESFIDFSHDLGRFTTPAEFEELLPDVAGIAVDDGFGDATKQFVHHDGFVLLRNTVECLLNNVATEWVHAEAEGIATDRICDGNDLFRSAMFEAALDQEISKTVDHQRISLVDDSLNDLILLLSSANLQFLLKENGRLLVIVADNLVNDILPVTCNALIKQPTVVQRLESRNVSLGARCSLR